MEVQPSAQSSSQKENFVNTRKRLLENRNWAFPVVLYFTWKLEFFSNILSVTVASSNDAATNDVDGRIGNKTWCKCEWCNLMKISIESACCLEIPEICKTRFSGTLCLYVSRSDPHFMLGYSMRENSVNYLISTHIWFLPNQNKSFISLKTLRLSFSIKYFTLLITFFS